MSYLEVRELQVGLHMNPNSEGWKRPLAWSWSASIARGSRVNPRAQIERLRWKVRRDPRDANARWELGKKLDEAGWQGAVQQLRYACRLDAANPEFHESLGRVLSCSFTDKRSQERAERLAEPEFRAALRLYRRRLRRRPSDADLFFKIGRTLGHMNQNQQAVAAYRKAIALRPDFAEAHWELYHRLQHFVRDV